jgi:hypothetical protein
MAAVWSDAFAPVRLPRERFVVGVAEHDRGYPEHDADEIGNLPPGRWLEIQERGFAPTGEDAVVDLVVALHVRRLVSSHNEGDARRVIARMDAQIPALVRTAGVTTEDAAAADRITNLCDRVSFDICLEQPDSATVEVLASDGAVVDVHYAVDGQGTVALAPWPLHVDRLAGTLQGFAAEGYPDDLVPVPTPVVLEPAGGSR